jgi:phosphoglycerol transferase
MAKKKRNKSGNPAAGSAQTIAEVRPAAPIAQSTYSVAGSSALPSTSFVSSRYFEWLALAVASAISYWILTARLVGVNVSVLVDEYAYVLDAHYRGLDEALYPNQLFQLVFAPTRLCGPDFYSCARSLNASFVLASGVVIYYLAKRVSGKVWLGAIVWAATVFGSLGTYTAYFMPEAISNFFMILFFFVVVRICNSQNPLVWLIAGSVLGIAALAKPHAFFIFPAIAIFILLSSRSLFNKALIPAIIRFGLFAASFFAIKFGVGFAMAGERALSIFGYYGGSGTAVELVESTILADSTLENLLVTSGGQILMTVMILGIAVPVSIIGLLDSVFGNKTNFAPVAFRSLFAIVLLNMMAVVAMFEAWQNLTNWMHTRYHSYLIPLSLVVLVEAYVRSEAAGNKLIKRLITGVFLVVASINLITAAVPYGTNWIDAPDFRAHIDNLFLSSTAILISIGLGIWWLWSKKAPMVGAIALALVASIASGSYISGFLSSNFGQDSTYDQLGRILRDYIPQDELDRTVLVGDNQTNMERVLFQTLSGEARKIPVPAEGFDVKQLEASDRWLIKVGEPLILGLGAPTISGTGFSLYSLSPENTLTPRENEVMSFSNPCESAAEGAWACGNSVSITTSDVLPGSPEIDLIFEVSGPEANSTLEFALGKTVLSGEFSVGTYALSLAFPGEVPGGSLEIRLGAGSQVDRTSDSKFLRVISVNVVKR